MFQPVGSDVEPMLLEMHVETCWDPFYSCATLLAGCVACPGDQIQAFEFFLVISFCKKEASDSGNSFTLESVKL